MKKDNFIIKFAGVFAKITGYTAGVGGTYALIKELLKPEQSLLEFLTSPIAICIYLLLLLTAVFVLLSEKYKSLQGDNEELNKKVRELNLELNEASTRLEAAMRNGQIATFKESFFLSTPKLYIDLSDKIHNDIVISRMDISNTIEPTGVGTKRDSKVKMSIQGYAKADNVNQIQILVAGDTIVKWKEIDLKAIEISNGKMTMLNARIADNGQDSFLKQVVISFLQKKKKDDLINIDITWVWPNMLDVENEDYTALPIALSKETKAASLKLLPKIPLAFAEAGAYIYREGQTTADLIMDLTPDTDNSISYDEENPEYKSCLILYYKIKK